MRTRDANGPIEHIEFLCDLWDKLEDSPRVGHQFRDAYHDMVRAVERARVYMTKREKVLAKKAKQRAEEREERQREMMDARNEIIASDLRVTENQRARIQATIDSQRIMERRENAELWK